jgi:hypothetical protein
MKRYYALLLKRGGGVQLVKALDGEQILAEAPFDWALGETHALALEVSGRRLKGFVDGNLAVEFEDYSRPLNNGGIALVLTEGRMATNEVAVHPLSTS